MDEIDKGFGVRITEAAHQTILHVAASAGQTAVLQRLLKTLPLKALQSRDRDNVTLLERALWAKQLDCAKVLIDNLPAKYLKKYLYVAIIALPAAALYILDRVEVRADKFVSAACCYNRADVLRRLYENGATTVPQRCLEWLYEDPSDNNAEIFKILLPFIKNEQLVQPVWANATVLYELLRCLSDENVEMLLARVDDETLQATIGERGLSCLYAISERRNLSLVVSAIKRFPSRVVHECTPHLCDSFHRNSPDEFCQLLDHLRLDGVVLHHNSAQLMDSMTGLQLHRELQRTENLVMPEFVDRALAVCQIADGLALLNHATPEIAARYRNNPLETRRQLQLQYKMFRRRIVHCYGLMVFISDGYLQVAAQNFNDTARFFRIATRLPIEIQAVLAHRTQESGGSIISSAAFEHVFGRR